MTATPEAAAPANRRLRKYIAGWSVAAVLGAALTFATAAGDPRPSWGLLVSLLLLTVAAEAASTGLRVRDDNSTGMSLSLLEFAVAVDLLLLPSGWAAAVIVGGVLVTHLFRVPGVQKLLFNTSQHAVAASISAAVVSLVPLAGEAITAPRAAAATVGVLAYSATNSLALARLFTILDLPRMREQLTDRPGFVLATAFGSASVGIIGAALWSAYPALVFTVVGPALALYLSYGSSFRMKALLSEVSSERDHLDRVVSGVQEGIVLLDDRGVVRLWNTAMERITGRSAGEALGQPGRAVMAGVDEEGTPVDPERPVWNGQGTTDSGSVTLTDAAGEPVETRISHTLVQDERGRCIGDVVMVQDLSREREAHSLKEDFVARVSHELRTPLSPLRGYAQLLLSSGDRIAPEKRDAMLTTMVERVGHLERLIEDLLLVSRVSSGSLSPHEEVTCEPTDVEAVVRRMTEWVGRDHPQREVRVRGDGTVPPAWADPLRVGQVVTNLVTNACKYATPGTPIEVAVTGTADGVRVDVRDHGPGIPDDKLEAIFERFQRLEDPQRMRTGGLGLGLYIARHLAVAMDGRLEVASRRGRGSTFSLVLPAATNDQRRTAPSDGAGRRSGSTVHRRERMSVAASAR
jgi:PAS domain S-box-containing protein